MLVCERLTDAVRKNLERDIGYRHTIAWWNARGNRQKVSEHSVRHQWMQRGMFPKGHDKPAGTYHGAAQIALTCRYIYFDLGGEYNIMDINGYENILQDILSGKDNVTNIITPQELGFSKRGVPIDMAGGTSNQSSIAWIKHWIRTNITVTTYH